MTRAFGYIRVSTPNQAAGELSLPDQRNRIEAFCRKKGWKLVQIFEEPGITATDDNRPAFQAMLDAAKAPAKPVDVIVTHSFDRFARNMGQAAAHRYGLKLNGVDLISVTQPVSDDPIGELMRSIHEYVAESRSLEISRDTRRAMEENARQGFWNGSQPPFGYRVAVSEKRGRKLKKKIEVAPHEAEVVRLIYRLYLHGDGKSGPLGVKRIVEHLNMRGVTTRAGGRFGIKTVHDILCRTTYCGTHYFNQHDKDGIAKPESAWIAVAVPPIIGKAEFDAVRARLSARSPKKAAPRVVGSPCLLTGLAFCADCGRPLTLSTGKSGQYRYYACSGRSRIGTAECKGQRVAMAELDQAVLSRVSEKFLGRARLEPIVTALLAALKGSRDDLKAEHCAARSRLRQAETGLRNLLDALKRGAGGREIDDEVRELQRQKNVILADIARIEARLDAPAWADETAARDWLLVLVQDQFVNGEVAFRKAYLRLLVGRIEVGAESIRICGADSKGAIGATSAGALKRAA